jgi:hypothetical protein
MFHIELFLVDNMCNWTRIYSCKRLIEAVEICRRECSSCEMNSRITEDNGNIVYEIMYNSGEVFFCDFEEELDWIKCGF